MKWILFSFPNNRQEKEDTGRLSNSPCCATGKIVYPEAEDVILLK